VDGLRGKSEEDLKLIYMKFFRDDLIKRWEDLTADMNFGDITDEEILTAMTDRRRERQTSDSIVNELYQKNI
jgi:hypothetical protein